jgi:hypothetical protein
MIKLNHYLTDKQMEYLKSLSRETGLSVAEILRRLIDRNIKEGKKDV